MSDAWDFICTVARRERPKISDLTLLKWRTRGVPAWLRWKAAQAAIADGRTLTDDDFAPRRRRSSEAA